MADAYVVGSGDGRLSDGGTSDCASLVGNISVPLGRVY